MPHLLPRILAAVAAITLAAPLAAAHVAPSVDDNNRYLKVTPLGDRVRLAYTVFFGEVPGASERRGIDANRDGKIDDAEAHAFGDKLAAQVAAALLLEVDGHVEPVRWTLVDVGMGEPVVNAGSFSVDMVAYPCLSPPRGQHTVRIHDRFRIPRPGETEVKIEDSRGVTIERARVGPADDPSHDFRFAGPGGPVEDDGLELVFTAGDAAPVTADGTCTGRGPAAAGGSNATVFAIVGGSVVFGAAALLLMRRRARTGE